MKALKVFQLVGSIVFLVATIFNLINLFANKVIFPNILLFLMLLIAVAGIICGIIVNVKSK